MVEHWRNAVIVALTVYFLFLLFLLTGCANKVREETRMDKFCRWDSGMYDKDICKMLVKRKMEELTHDPE